MPMKKPRYTPEQIAEFIASVETLKRDGNLSVAEACLEAGVSEQSYYRWKREGAASVPMVATQSPDTDQMVVSREMYEYMTKRIYELTMENQFLQEKLRKHGIH